MDMQKLTEKSREAMLATQELAIERAIRKSLRRTFSIP